MIRNKYKAGAEKSPLFNYINLSLGAFTVITILLLALTMVYSPRLFGS